MQGFYHTNEKHTNTFYIWYNVPNIAINTEVVAMLTAANNVRKFFMTWDQILSGVFVLTICGAFIVWVVKSWVNKVNTKQTDLEQELMTFRMHVATDYVTKTDHNLHIQRIEQTQIDQYARIEVKLDKIFDIIERKADK